MHWTVGVSPRTAPAPWSGVRRAMGRSMSTEERCSIRNGVRAPQVRRCGGGGRRPGGVRRTGRLEFEKTEGLRVGSKVEPYGVETGEGGCSPFAPGGAQTRFARTPRQPHPNGDIPWKPFSGFSLRFSNLPGSPGTPEYRASLQQGFHPPTPRAPPQPPRASRRPGRASWRPE